MDIEVKIRNYRYEDVDILLEMTHDEGWDLSKIDCTASLEVDNTGLLVAEDMLGVPVGFICLFNLTPGMVYIDNFVVRKDLRGKGIGKKLWKKMLERSSGNILALDSVSDMKSWYRDQGFQYEAYTFRSYKGTKTSLTRTIAEGASSIVPLSDDLLHAFVEYDMQIYPYSRETILRRRFYDTTIYSVVALRNKGVVGWASFDWKSKNVCVIRAMYGDDKDVANALLKEFLRQVPDGSVVMFDLFEDRQLPECFSTFECVETMHRLYTKDIAPIKTNKIYFITDHMV